jgi:hypothetical protein
VSIGQRIERLEKATAAEWLEATMADLMQRWVREHGTPLPADVLAEVRGLAIDAQRDGPRWRRWHTICSLPPEDAARACAVEIGADEHDVELLEQLAAGFREHAARQEGT